MNTEKYEIGQFTYLIHSSPDNEGKLYYVNFEVFRLEGETYSLHGVTFDPPRKEFARRGAASSMDTTDNLEDAKRVMSGMLKWDGCSHVDFYPDDTSSAHFCGKVPAMELGHVIATVYDLAKVTMGDTVMDEDLFDGK